MATSGSADTTKDDAVSLDTAEMSPVKSNSADERDDVTSPKDTTLCVPAIDGPDPIMHAMSLQLSHQGSSSNVVKNLKTHCCEKRKLMMYPIKLWQKKYRETYVDVHIELVPEAFRMWFYYGFFIYTFLAVFISSNWSDQLDLEDNVFIDLYGGNNICLFYDFPPFSYFGAILWFPQLFNILCYEALDQFRVYEDYLEGKCSRKFIILYSMATVYECLSWIGFLQITATSPVEVCLSPTIKFISQCQP